MSYITKTTSFQPPLGLVRCTQDILLSELTRSGLTPKYPRFLIDAGPPLRRRDVPSLHFRCFTGIGRLTGGKSPFFRVTASPSGAHSTRVGGCVTGNGNAVRHAHALIRLRVCHLRMSSLNKLECPASAGVSHLRKWLCSWRLVGCRCSLTAGSL